MDFVTDLVFKRNKDREVLNIGDAKRIVLYETKKNGHNLNDVVIANHYKPNKKIKGTFSPEDKNIYLFNDPMLNYIEEKANSFKEEYNPEGTIIDVFNFYTLVCAYHEIGHSRQDYIVNSEEDSLTKSLLTPFFKFKVGDKIYDKNYSDFPTEVNADNIGYVMAYEIFKKLPKNFMTLHDHRIYQREVLNSLLYSNYQVYLKGQEVYAPTERIADAFDEDTLDAINLDLDDYANLIYHAEKLSLFDKLMLGLPITYEEYSYTNLLIDQLANGYDIDAIKCLKKKR